MPPRQRSGKKSLVGFEAPDFSTKESETTGYGEHVVKSGETVDSALKTPGEFSSADQYRDDISANHKDQGTNKSLSEKDGANVTYAGTAFASFGLAVNAASAVQVFMKDSSTEDRAKAIMGLGLSGIGLAGSISSTVKTAEGGDQASAATKMADGVLSEIAGVAGAMKEAWDLVVKIAEVISKNDALEDVEKAVAGMEIVKSLLQTGKGVIDTINAFMRHLGTVSTGLAQAAPGIGIAINACDMIVNGVNIAHSYISMVEMRDDKRATKEKVLGRKANKSKGIRGFFGGHESIKVTARQTIDKHTTAMSGGTTLSDKDKAELRDAEDYMLSRNLQKVAQKRINRGALNITANAVNIAGDIAVLSGAGAAVGAGLKATGTGISVGAAALRTGKQWYHNAKGDKKSETNKLKTYDTMITHLTRAITEANAAADNVAQQKALRQVIASGMTPGKMNGYLPDALKKHNKAEEKAGRVAVSTAPDSVKKEAGKALYGDWVNALKKR